MSSLPPFPHEVPLPATFGDWYDLAARNLGVVERRDSTVRRIGAGLIFLLLLAVGLALASEPLAVALGWGYGGQPVDVVTLVVGAAVVVVTLAWWARYRRDWVQVRRLRHAWARALRDPAVLSLPERTLVPVSGPDPEGQHDYRARRHAELVPYPGLRSVGGVTGMLDFLRAAFYPVALFFGGILVAVAADQDDVGEALRFLPALPLVLVSLFATIRAWRRFADAQLLNALLHDDRRRWTGWRVLHELAEVAPATPWWRRLNLAVLPVVFGGLIVLGTRLQVGPAMDGVVIAVSIVVGPVIVVSGSFVVRAVVAGIRAGKARTAIRVRPDEVPALGPVTVTPGAAMLRWSEPPVLMTAGVEVPIDGATLVSGAPRMLASRRHWLVLADESQIPFACADVRRLRARASTAGLRVL